MSKLCRACAVALLILAGVMATPALAAKRIALVVGNSTYRHVTPLANPANDAKLIVETLQRLGFAVVGGGAQLDLDKPALDRAVQEFGNALQGADVGLFYYSGHGVQVRGANYLVPVGANPSKEADVDFQMLDTSLVLRQLEGAGTRLKLVILDACRNNPFGGRGLRTAGAGLAQMQAPAGTMISFATQPGGVAQDGSDGNSPFTRALAAAMAKPGLDVFRVFNEVGLAVMRATGGAQQPWVSNSPIEGVFTFGGAPADHADAPPRVSPPTALALVRPDRPAPPTATAPQPAVGIFKPDARNPPLSEAQERALKPKNVFKECDACPEMVVVRAGRFAMGGMKNPKAPGWWEIPRGEVTFARPFAVGRFAVTFDEWDACVAGGGCEDYRPSDNDWGRGPRPVIHVAWEDAKAYVAWISKKTGKPYRLLSEAERSYVAAAGTTTAFWWGRNITTAQANFAPFDGQGRERGRTVPVDSFGPNPWGLYQVWGNVSDWGEDCWNENHGGAPMPDGSARTTGDCSRRVILGRNWDARIYDNETPGRDSMPIYSRSNSIGFRVARDLTP
jgi:formylglycine-generating enzyme required for sulfatase activity